MPKPIGNNGGLQRLIELIKIAFLRVDDALSRKAAKNHSHDISDVDGLSTALSGKASSTHYHNQSDVDGLVYTLSQKASVGHTHAQSDVTGLTDALAGKASTSHTHAQSDVTGLTDALAGKASTSHTHAQSDVTGLTEALAGKASTSHTHPQGDVTGLTDALAGKASTSHTHAQSDVTGLADALAGKASSSHAHGSITNGGAITANTTPESADYPIFGDNSDSGKLKRATFQDFHKAMVGQMSSGNSDVVDGTEFLSSYASSSGFGESNYPNQIFKRTFLHVWNYIQAKISSVLGLTASQYAGNAATATSAASATSATNDSAGNNIASTYFPLAGKKAITGVYKDSPSLLHNIGFENTSVSGIWRKFCLIYTRAAYRNGIGAIHIQGRQTIGTIYVALNSSATAPAEGNNTLNPSVRYLSFMNSYNGIYYRVNEYNQLELWFKAHETYENISITDVDFGAYFLDLNMTTFNHSVVVSWTNEVSQSQPANLKQAGDVVNTTLSSAISYSTGDVLEITDSNWQTYLTTYQGGTPISPNGGDILTLDKPYSTVIFNLGANTDAAKVAVVTGNSTVLTNGRRITILGKWMPQENGGALGSSAVGRFSEYLYEYRGGSTYSSWSSQLVEAREEFLYFNGVWYSKGY